MSAILSFQGCDVHELPDPPASVDVKLRLEFDTHMGEQSWVYDTRADGKEVTATFKSDIYSHDMRYTVRAYPIIAERLGQNYKEFVFSRSIARVGSDYTLERDIVLPAGEYRFMVWADFVDKGSLEHKYYNHDDFASITLHGEHKANTDYRDAFSGTTDRLLETTIQESGPQSVVVQMKRPMAKYTFVTTDLQEFIDKEAYLMAVRGEIPDSTRSFQVAEDETRVDTRGVDLSNYRIVVKYPMYMPNKYDMHEDEAFDVAPSESYESTLTLLNANEARMAFDYVMINDPVENPSISEQSKILLQIYLYDKDGNELSKSGQFNAPIARSMNTIIRGKFLMLDTQGGVSIDPSFDNDHNIKIE